MQPHQRRHPSGPLVALHLAALLSRSRTVTQVETQQRLDKSFKPRPLRGSAHALSYSTPARRYVVRLNSAAVRLEVRMNVLLK